MDNSRKAALVSTPWPLFSRPSIQLGALKAYLANHVPGWNITAVHFFLRVAETIGYPLYHAISERTWLSESVYAALLYPERMTIIKAFFQGQARGKQHVSRIDFESLVSRVETVSEKFIREIEWQNFKIVGFSACLCQMTSALYLMKRIKTLAPETILAVGGSIIGSDLARDFLNAFHQIDLVVTGEGERPLAAILQHLDKGKTLDELPGIDGVHGRFDSPENKPGAFNQMADLSTLPAPDFTEYFELLNSFSPEKKFFPTLAAEISRGCWWQSAGPGLKEKGCAFCNLNRQWSGYRTKSVKQAVREITDMASKYRLLNIAFMDNALPPKKSLEIFEALSRSGADFKFFSEIRAGMDKQTLRVMRRAGMAELQVGIESLSSNLLKKLNKGTTAIENLEIMKHCEELGLTNQSNLIIHFPKSDEIDVAQTLRTIEFAYCFRPLRIVRFWLGMGSPVQNNLEKFGIRAAFNHPGYKALFPENIFRNVRFMIQSYRGDKQVQKKRWRPVKKAVAKWKASYEKLHRNPENEPILYYQDGGDFLIIHQRIADSPPQNHRLVGTSRSIYLYCTRNRELKQILARFPGLTQEMLLPFLKTMTQKRLMFEEDGRYLSLAILSRMGIRNNESNPKPFFPE